MNPNWQTSKCANHAGNKENKTEPSLGQLELKLCSHLKTALNKLHFGFSPLKFVAIFKVLKNQTKVTKIKLYPTRLPFFFLPDGRY
jgi:hypothetical protein